MLPFLKSYGAYLAVAAAVVAAIGWYRTEIKRAEARGQAELMAEQAEIAWAALQDSAVAWSERKASYDSARTAMLADLDRLRGVARVAEQAASQAVLDARVVISALSDSLATLTREDLTVIGAAVDTLQHAVTACNAALGRCEDLVTASDARVWDLEAQQRQALDLNRAQALTIERLQALRPSSGGLVKYGGWLVATVTVVAAIVR